MLEINGKVLTNAEVIEKLGEKITRPIEFKLCEQFQSSLRYTSKGNTSWVKRYMETFGLSNRAEVRDFTNGGTDVIIYFTQIVGDPQKPMERRYIVGDTLNKIEFSRGFLHISEGQEDLLLFLRLHEQCQTNESWTKTDVFGNQKNKPVKAFLFKEIIPEKENEQSYDLTHIRLRAQTAAFDPKRIPLDAAIIMATAYGMSEARYKGEKSIRQFLYDKATNNPEQFITDMSSSSFDLTAIVQSALEFKVIKFDAPYYRWAIDNPKKYGDGRICQVPAGKGLEWFVQWMRETDKSGVLEELKKKVSEATDKSDSNFEVEDKKPLESLMAQFGVKTAEELHDKIRNLESIAKDSKYAKPIDPETFAPIKEPVGDKKPRGNPAWVKKDKIEVVAPQE